MKVILLRDIENLGKKFDIKEVSGGYARNFLFAHGLAELATESAIKALTLKKRRLAKEEVELAKQLSSLAHTIAERPLAFYLRADKDGRLFGSVTKDAVLKELRKSGLITKERVKIRMDRPLRELGEHELEVELKKGVKTRLKVILHPQP